MADGRVLPCDAARGMLYGTPVQAFIRPENVRVGAAAAALPGGFEAQVTHVEFLGPVCRLSLQAGRLRLEADIAPEQVAQPGALLPVALPAERLMVFPVDA